MKITYTGPSEDLDIGIAVVRRVDEVRYVLDADGVEQPIVVAPACVTVDVHDELAASLIESGDFVAEPKSSKTKPEEAAPVD
jgi:hypothetical protein